MGSWGTCGLVSGGRTIPYRTGQQRHKKEQPRPGRAKRAKAMLHYTVSRSCQCRSLIYRDREPHFPPRPPRSLLPTRGIGTTNRHRYRQLMGFKFLFFPKSQLVQLQTLVLGNLCAAVGVDSAVSSSAVSRTAIPEDVSWCCWS